MSIDSIVVLVSVGFLILDNWVYSLNPHAAFIPWITLTLLLLIGSFLIKLLYDVTFWGITIQPISSASRGGRNINRLNRIQALARSLQKPKSIIRCILGVLIGSSPNKEKLGRPSAMEQW